MKKGLHIVKIGGNVLNDERALSAFLEDFANIETSKILVHGGGKAATDLAGELGISQLMWQGRRITDAATLKIAIMVYAGQINKQLVATLQSAGVKSLGLCGADLDIIRCNKRTHPEIDFGFVGDIADNGVDTQMLTSLLELGVTPVFSAITHDGKGQLLNTNADTIASSIAVAMSSSYDVQLNYCFEKNGVLIDSENGDSFVRKMNLTLFRKLQKEEIVTKGMLPKLENSFQAIQNGVKGVYIGSYINLNKMIIRHEDAGTELICH